MERNLTLEEYSEYTKHSLEDLIKMIIDEKEYGNRMHCKAKDTEYELKMFQNAVRRHGVTVDCNVDAPHLAHHNKTSK